MAETDWTGQHEAIRLAIARALKLPDKTTIGGVRTHKRVEWAGRDSADRWAQGGALVELRLGAIVPRGQLEPRYDFVAGDTPALSKYVATYGRLEQFTVTVAIDVDDQSPGSAAPGTIAGRLRTRLQRPDVMLGFQTTGVALINVGQTFEADYEMDGRQVSSARVDVFFAHTATDRDDDVGGDYISEVHGDGTEALVPVVLDVTPFETATFQIVDDFGNLVTDEFGNPVVYQ